jgi:hypothetical protein
MSVSGWYLHALFSASMLCLVIKAIRLGVSVDTGTSANDADVNTVVSTLHPKENRRASTFRYVVYLEALCLASFTSGLILPTFFLSMVDVKEVPF